jgi:membrane-associated phospholipid phosphatase
LNQKKLLFLLLNLFLATNIFAQNADIDLLKSINVGRNQSLDGTFKFISDADAPIALAAPLSVLAVGFAKNDKALKIKGLEMTASLIVAVGVELSLKKIINRDRPFVTYPFIQNVVSEDNASFPSGHTSVAFATATSLSLQFPKWYVIVPSYTYAAAVGYSRLHLGVHYPTDVLGGAIVGAGSALLCNELNKWLHKKNVKR